MNKPQTLRLLRCFLLVTLLLGLGALWRFIEQTIAEELLWATRSRTYAIYGIGASLVTLLLSLVATFTPLAAGVLAGLNWAAARFSRLPRLALWGLAIVLLVAYPALVRGYYGRYLLSDFPRYFSFWLAAVLLALVLLVLVRWPGWPPAFLLSTLLVAFSHQISAYLAAVSTFPLSLNWSETSRYYYASALFAERLYGIEVPLAVTHPSRYVMQAVPFLFGDLPLWVHRLWQPLMEAGLTLLAAGLLARRLGLSRSAVHLSFVLWAALFLFQGPVFYQMMILVAFIFWAADSARFWRTALAVVLASLWAGITRINWIPMPAVLAGMLYVLETPLPPGRGFRPWLGYLWRPALWCGLGLVAGLATQTWYMHNSGNPLSAFESSFTSDLLWYRLFPNSSYGLGILTGALLVSGPALLGLVWALRGGVVRWGGLRLFGLWALLLVFLVGGLVVSVKIGGGTNLHNLDAFLVLLLLWLAFLYFGKFQPQPGATTPPRLPAPLLAAIVLVPALFAVGHGGRLPEHDFVTAEAVIAEIQGYVDANADSDAEVLFISQRHLLTFDYITGVQNMEPRYEKLVLMEMAMARNAEYLNDFERNLRNAKYAFIVTDPLFNRIKADDGDPLAEENNAWVQRVARVLLCGYEPDYTALGVQVLVPRANWRCDP